jgi:hypothetical protein
MFKLWIITKLNETIISLPNLRRGKINFRLFDNVDRYKKRIIIPPKKISISALKNHTEISLYTRTLKIAAIKIK